MTTGSRKRFSFANLEEVLPLPNLLDIQKNSFKWFLEKGLKEAFDDISPIEDFAGNLRLDLSFDPNDSDQILPPKYSVDECKEKDMTYSSRIFVKASFTNKVTGEIKENTLFMGDFPIMTDKGTFIINGTERVIVSQLIRSPGVLFQLGKDAKTILTGTVHPYRGEWVEIDLEDKPSRDLNAGARIARKRRLSLFTLIRGLGYDDPAFIEAFVKHFDFLRPQYSKDKFAGQTREEALVEIYKRVRPGEPLSHEASKNYFENSFFNPKRYDLSAVGRYKLTRKLGPEIDKLNKLFKLDLQKPDPDSTTLSAPEILATATYMLHLASGESGYRVDDQDHFANRRIRAVGELIQNQVKVGLSRMERVVRERMTTLDEELITPNNLTNTRPVVSAIKEFFGTSQLSQFMDQHNPLSGLAHKRRLSALGPGGLSRERAGFEVRDVHTSHYGRMCPIETPEGPNIGLIGALATYGRVNEFGFIETPYRKVVNGKVTEQIQWLAADEEEDHVIAQANAPFDSSGKFIEDKVLVRRGPQGAGVKFGAGVGGSYGTTSEIDYVSPAEVDLMDVSPKQIVSVSTSLIPFVEHDDANRALMGANMQKQAVPLLVPEAPYVGTGVEFRAAVDAGDVVIAKGKGVVTTVSADIVHIEYAPNQKDEFNNPLPTKEVILIDKFRRSNQNSCVNSRVIVVEGQHVNKGDIIADGAAVDNGELALGKNLLVAFMPWEGYNYEDAIILSQRLVTDDVLTSIHIEEHEVDARDTKLGTEEITRDIPNLSEEVMADLDDRGIIRIGAEVTAGDILVGKVTPKGETELTPEERLLRAIFGEKARDVRDTSMRVPHGESGTVIDVKVYTRDDAHELPPGVNELVRVYVAQKRKITEGDKLAGRHGNKGVISKILPVEDMPYMEDGTPVDIILNPLGVPSRMNVGQVLESHLGYAAKCGWKDAEKESNQSSKIDKKTRPKTPPAVWVSSPAFDGAHWDEEDRTGGHKSIKDIFAGLNPDGKDGSKLINDEGKVVLYNGRTGESYDNPISVGYMYILKLAHLVDDKIHARSTGPYSMITQQPLGGKAQFGGQRFGEMEVWALEAYGAAFALQELLTLKSDDTSGRVKVYEKIVKGESIPEPGIPESFKVLIKEMQSLCLDVEVISNTGEEIHLKDLDFDLDRESDHFGIDFSHHEFSSDDFGDGFIAMDGSY